MKKIPKLVLLTSFLYCLFVVLSTPIITNAWGKTDDQVAIDWMSIIVFSIPIIIAIMTGILWYKYLKDLKQLKR